MKKWYRAGSGKKTRCTPSHRREKSQALPIIKVKRRRRERESERREKTLGPQASGTGEDKKKWAST